MNLDAVTTAHYERQTALARRSAVETDRLWGQVDPGDIRGSWRSLMARVLTVVSSAQGIAAASSGNYVDEALRAQGIAGQAVGRLAVAGFAGVASDGRDLIGLLWRPAVTALVAVRDGATVERALAGGRVELDMIVRTQIADAGRSADGVAIAVRPAVTGYVRMLSPPSCSRCIILAGKRYRWNAGFRRHPRCDCRHIPTAEDADGAKTTRPRKAFDAMSPTEQDKAFTKSGAQAIRDGADISQVVNARKGAFGLTPAGARITAAEAKEIRNGLERGRLQPKNVFGQDLFVTTEGTTTRGLAGQRLGAREDGVKRNGGRYRSAKPPRLMPESIYQIAGDNRDEAIRLLRRNGYIL